MRLITQSLLFSTAPRAPACALVHAVWPAASAGHVSSVFAIIVMLPVSFVLNRNGVNERSAETGGADAPTHKIATAPRSSRRGQRSPPGLVAVDEPGRVKPAVVGTSSTLRPPDRPHLIRRG